MRRQLHNTAYRYTRYGAMAWALFVLSFGLSKIGGAYFGASESVCSAFGTCAQGAFAFGSVFLLATSGIAALSRTTRF